MKKKRSFLPTLLVLSGMAGYLVLFFATRLPSVEGVTGGTFRRAGFFAWLLLPESFLEAWFGKPPDASLSDRLPVLAIAAVILGCSAGVGWLLMMLCRADRGLTRLETVVFSTAVGLNAVSTYVLLVGLSGRLDNVLIFAVPAAVVLAAAGRLHWRRVAAVPPERSKQRTDCPKMGPTGRSPWAWTRRSQWAWTGLDAEGWMGISPHWLWLGAPFVAVILLGGMLPPIDFDVREYHLQAPKEFFQQGRVVFLPHNVYGNMPLGAEMLCLLAMVIAEDWWLGALAGKTVIAAMTPLTALALLAAGRRLFSPAAGIVAALLYISIPWIVQVSTSGLVEGALAYYLLTAVYAVLLAKKGVGTILSPGEDCSAKRRPEKIVLPPFLLSGYLAGGAVSCKYPAVLFVAVPLAAWVFLAYGSTKRRLAWKPLGVFLLAAGLGCGLWFGKNWALTGNPAYPLLYRVFDGKTWSAEKNQQWNRVHRPRDFSAGTLAKDLGRLGWRSEWLSPLVVPLAALALLRWPSRRPVIVLVAYFCYVIAAWWLLTHRIDRFWIPALPVLALLAGAGACWSQQRLWRGMLVALLLVSLGWSLLVVTSGPGGYNAYFVRLARLRHDPQRVDPWHEYFNTHASDGRVLMVGDAQVFDLEVPVLYGTCFDDSLFERLVKGRTTDEIRDELTALGVSHVYVHWGEVDRYRRPGNYGFTDFVRPAVFDDLVEQGVLEPLPRIEGHPGRGYRLHETNR